MQGELNSDVMFNINTDGRTDGLTKKLVQVDFKVKAVDAHARTDEIESIGQIIGRGLPRVGTRHAVIRAGERDPIAVHVRSAVWFRDRGRCQIGNHSINGEWHLDHITPWSAGGADDSTNLRVLCRDHNLERSNWVDIAEGPRRPVTWWCLNCYQLDEHVWSYGGKVVECPIHRRFNNPERTPCRVVRAYWYAEKNHDERATWHQREPLVGAETVAYCAHCDAPGLTDHVL